MYRTLYRVTHIIIFVTCLFFIKEYDQCSINICLTWELSRNQLTLVCKIKTLHLRIFFDDPFGNRQADCFPPYTGQCVAYYRNGTIRYNSETEEAIYTVRGEIDNQVIGTWTCRHGTGRDIATAIVSISAENEQTTTYDFKSTPKYYGSDSTVSGQSTIHNSQTVAASKGEEEGNNTDSKIRDNVMRSHKSNNLLFVLVAGIVIPLLGSFVWIRRKYRTVVLQIPENQSDTIQNERNSDNNGQEDSSNYETINESEMLQYPVVLSLNEFSFAFERQFSDQSIETSSKSSMSDKSQLEFVEEDYLNPYTTMNVSSAPNNAHVYSMT